MTGRTRTEIRVWVVALAAAAAVSGPVPVEAQPRAAARARAAQAAGARAAEAPDQAEIVRLFDAYAVMQAQEALALDDATFGPFVTRLRALQEVRRRHVRQRNAALRELRTLLEGTGNEPVMKERLDTLARLEAAAAAEESKARASIDELLDVRQRARFRVLEQQLELRRLELIGRARQRLRSPRP